MVSKIMLSPIRLGAITDDTQMTLFTAEGLLSSWIIDRFNQNSDYFEIVQLLICGSCLHKTCNRIAAYILIGH